MFLVIICIVGVIILLVCGKGVFQYSAKYKKLAKVADENYVSRIGDSCTIKYCVKELNPENGQRVIKVAQVLFNGLSTALSPGQNKSNGVISGTMTVVSKATGYRQIFNCDWTHFKYSAMTTAQLVLSPKFKKNEDLTIIVNTDWRISSRRCKEHIEMEHNGY